MYKQRKQAPSLDFPVVKLDASRSGSNNATRSIDLVEQIRDNTCGEPTRHSFIAQYVMARDKQETSKIVVAKDDGTKKGRLRTSEQEASWVDHLLFARHHRK